VGDPKTDLDRLFALQYGYRSTQVVYVIAKLGLADHLADAQLTADELAARVHADSLSLGRVLRLAAFYGLVEERPGGRFGLTPLGRPLSGEGDDSAKAFATMLGEEHYGAWGSLLHSVKTGEPAFNNVYGAPFFDYMAAHPATQATFDAAMSAVSETFLGQLTDSYDFSKVRVLVDVGGGNGSVSARILKRNPAMQAVIYDQPQVLEAADRYLSEAGLRARCRLVPGDFFSSVAERGDLYVLSNIVHDWDDERAVRILRNCRVAMKTTGAVMLIEAVMPEHGLPSRVAMADVNMMVLLTGSERTEEQYRSLLREADLSLTRVIPMSALSLLEARPR